MEKFFIEVERRAFRTAMVATGDREEALDIVQEAMFKMVQRYSQRPQEEWGPLFHRILQSRILDWYRRAKVRSVVRSFFADQGEEGDELEYIVSDNESGDPSRQLKSTRAAEVLESAIRDLPIRQQQAFMLRIWEGFDVAETASIMRCSQGSVKTHLSRAVAKLREILGDHWP